MISSVSILSVAAWGVSLWILWLSAREREAARSGRRLSEGGADARITQNPLRNSDLEVRFAAWIQLGVLVVAWVRIGNDLFPSPRMSWSFALPLLASIPAIVSVWWGRSAGRRMSSPGRGRWILAPIRGLVMWVAWITGLQGRGRSAAGEAYAARPANARGAPATVAVREGVEDLISQTLEEIMIPRSQVVALQGKGTVREAIETVRQYPHSIYPVYGDSVDQPLGVVSILDLVQPDALERSLEELVRPARIVPETMSGMSLLGELCGSAIPAALVVDEYGGMAGLVTVEDLMEVLVGDLMGEHEVVRNRIVALGNGSYRVDGVCTVEEFNERFGEILPEGDYETVAGLYLDSAGRIPEEGDELRLPGVKLEVIERTERRILWLKAELRSAGTSHTP